MLERSSSSPERSTQDAPWVLWTRSSSPNDRQPLHGWERARTALLVIQMAEGAVWDCSTKEHPPPKKIRNLFGLIFPWVGPVMERLWAPRKICASGQASSNLYTATWGPAELACLIRARVPQILLNRIYAWYCELCFWYFSIHNASHLSICEFIWEGVVLLTALATRPHSRQCTR